MTLVTFRGKFEVYDCGGTQFAVIEIGKDAGELHPSKEGAVKAAERLDNERLGFPLWRG